MNNDSNWLVHKVPHAQAHTRARTCTHSRGTGCGGFLFSSLAKLSRLKCLWCLAGVFLMAKLLNESSRKTEREEEFQR